MVQVMHRHMKTYFSTKSAFYRFYRNSSEHGFWGHLICGDHRLKLSIESICILWIKDIISTDHTVCGEWWSPSAGSAVCECTLWCEFWTQNTIQPTYYTLREGFWMWNVFNTYIFLFNKLCFSLWFLDQFVCLLRFVICVICLFFGQSSSGIYIGAE